MFLGCTSRIPALYLTRVYRCVKPYHDRMDYAGG
jgi:hypothetical protein